MSPPGVPKSTKSRPPCPRFDATHTTHLPEPDYTRPLFELPPEKRARLFGRLKFLYGGETARRYLPELERILKVYYAHKPLEMIEREKALDPRERFTEKDVILITYGDLLAGGPGTPLHTLADFCDRFLQGTINTLHLLPFFPYSSDRGFSIIDFETVDPNLGAWEDIADLEGRYQLMFDGVINHVSSKSRWFQEFLNGNPGFKDFFLAFDSEQALSPEQRRAIFRPRTSDVLTRFETIGGPRWVWTTFSEDQIDLNYHHPEVLLRVVEILLLYVRRGADIIRLDAITYLWEEPGTTCVHLAQTHEVVRLFRDILDTVAPAVALITETNVPHEENVSYFGRGDDEAWMVYNFALPPLVLHTFYTENATALSQWARTLATPSDTATFFNFLDSHDGVGLLAVKDILKKEEIDYLVRRARGQGGFISYKTGQDGREEPYEINITWYSALNEEDSDEDVAYQVRRFTASRAIALVLQGVPGLYFPSLFGSRNDIEGVLTRDSKRAINRDFIDVNLVFEALEYPLSKVRLLDETLGRLIRVRTANRAFHPHGPQKILSLVPEVFACYRVSPEGDRHVLALIGVSNDPAWVEVPLSELGTLASGWFDLLGRKAHQAADGKIKLTLWPYDVLLLTPESEAGEAAAA
ncbi:MAG: sugar phosphorylase [Thermodesulfobacteriota bacterium]